MMNLNTQLIAPLMDAVDCGRLGLMVKNRNVHIINGKTLVNQENQFSLLELKKHQKLLLNGMTTRMSHFELLRSHETAGQSAGGTTSPPPPDKPSPRANGGLMSDRTILEQAEARGIYQSYLRFKNRESVAAMLEQSEKIYGKGAKERIRAYLNQMKEGTLI